MLQSWREPPGSVHADQNSKSPVGDKGRNDDVFQNDTP